MIETSFFDAIAQTDDYQWKNALKSLKVNSQIDFTSKVQLVCKTKACIETTRKICFRKQKTVIGIDSVE